MSKTQTLSHQAGAAVAAAPKDAEVRESATSTVTPAPSTSPLASCPCGHRFRVKNELAGSKVKCPKCGTSIAVHAAAKAPTAPAPRFAKYGDYAAVVERQKPIVASPTELSQTALSWNLNRIIKRLERQNGDNRERAGERRRAILELAATRDRRAVDAILPLTDDPWDVVRQGAAAALGDLGEPSATPVLIRLLDDLEADVKREATISLGKIADARATQVLHVLAVHEPALRFLATEAIVKIGKPALPHLIQELSHSDVAVVIQTILTLQKMKATSVAEPLAKSLGHPTAVVRAHAAEALGLLEARSTIPQLVKTLADPHPPVRAQAAAALKRLGDRKVVKAMVPLLHDESVHVRLRVIEAIGELGEASHAPEVLPSLGHSDPSVRAASADTLRRLGNPVAVAPLLALLNDPDEAARQKAVAAISRFKPAAAASQLLNLLYDPSAGVRAKVADALGEIGHRSASTWLQSTLKSDSVVDVRAAAAKALGKIRDPQSVAALEVALQDDLVVRCRAVAALGEIAAKSSQPALLAMLRDSAPEIRFHAAQALGELGDVRVMKSLECLLSDENATVRRNAAKAMIKLGDSRGETLLEVAENPPVVRRPTQSPETTRPWLAISLTAVAVVLAVGGATVWFGRSSSTKTAIGKPPTTRGRVASIALSADGQKVAVGRTKGLIEVWDIASGKIVERIATDQSTAIVGVVFSAKDETLIFASGSGIQAVRNGKQDRRKSHQQPVQGLRIGPTSKTAITWSAAADVHIWDLETGMVAASLQLKPENLPTLAVDADGQRLAWGRADGSITIWDVADNSQARELKVEKGPVTGLVFSRDGTHLGALSPSVGVVIWDLSTGELVRQAPPPPANEAFYQRLFFAADDKRLLIQRGGRVEEISLENSDDPATIAESRGVPTDVLAIDPEVRRIVFGSSEQTGVWLVDFSSPKSAVRFDENPIK